MAATSHTESAPCEACPWTQKGQPDLTPAVRASAESGAWFCCHVNLGTCHGAARYGAAKRNMTDEERVDV